MKELEIPVLLLFSIAAFGGCSRSENGERAKAWSKAEADKSDEDPFNDSDYFTGPPLTEEMVRAAEEKLGYTLPQSYVRLIRVKNGGSLKRNCFPDRSAAGEYYELSGIPGIGGEWGIDSETLGSRYLIREWSYPDVGIVIGHTPSAGHDVFMLDYSVCGPKGEPRVIHVETEAREGIRVTVLAPDFETFLRGLVDRGQFEDER
jgi:hypothetical protein